VNRQILGAMTGLLGLAALAAWSIARPGDVPGPRVPAERPPLLLLTSLPLLFGEEFSLEASGSPALSRLEQRYKVMPIAVADVSSLKGQTQLLMAHPRAQPADVLVELDQWVREGGRVLLLADPRLDWPSERPLGDQLRPPPGFADTGLLAHWGLTLAAPEPDSAVTAGTLSGNGDCKVEDGGIVAHCRIGRGRATVIADADFLNVDDPEAEGLDLLVGELDRLESR
jgi:hypothetical protein